MTDNTDTKKKMLEALEFNLGIVSHSCRTVNISRQTHYQWLKNDKEYKEEVEAITESAIDYVVEMGYNEEYGARPLNRAIQKYVEDPISEEILKDNIKEGQTISISYSKVKEKIEVKVV